MLFWIIILGIISCAYSQIRETEYECGAHGRFEYCIDGIPGCVIGCHCHPGYYFDTDTKICEPNIKLTQNFRRQQYDYPEPTRIYSFMSPATVQALEETATTVKNAVDKKVDLITKDVDDLGDWLYNQFFKTIENQLINETKDEGVLITRRSETSPDILQKSARRSHKYWRSRKKKKKKKKGLKRKLLRITEDDSLFDSESGSESDEDSDSTTSESESSEYVSKEKKKGNDHGHKKIVVFNKRPKPPLPSFIFLPNMETPFFPPIGLPPPAMPMYPMIPVPPVMGPYPSYPGQHTHEGEDSIATTGAPVSSVPESTTSNGPATNVLTTAAPDIIVTADTDTAPDNPNINEDQNPVSNENANNITDTSEIPPGLRSRLRSRNRPRNKLMHQMREKLKRKNKLQNFFANEYQEEPSFAVPDDGINPDFLSNFVPNRHKTFPQYNIRNELSKLQDVDFKYLSQLIHKADLNKTMPVSSTPKELINNIAVNPPPSRRNFNDNEPNNYNDINQLLYNLGNREHQRDPDSLTRYVPIQPPHSYYNMHAVPYRKKIEATNDTYYANLGKQIASMIRNIDTDKEVDIEIEKTEPKSSVFNGYQDRSRSYWDRAIRSSYKPVRTHKRIYRKNDKKYLEKSNENLYSLENKVEMAASTKPTLDLQELENIISKMQRAKTNLIKKQVGFVSPESSKTSFNVNLLPRNNRPHYSDRKVNKSPKYNQDTNTYDINANPKRKTAEPPLLEPQNTLISDYLKIPDNVINKNETVIEKKYVPSVIPIRKSNIFVPLRFQVSNNKKPYTVLPELPNSHLVANMKLPFLQVTTRRTLYQEPSPMVMNHKTLNYYSGNNNQYLYNKPSMPVRLSTFSKRYQRPPTSSYFHEMHHSDFFDDLF